MKKERDGIKPSRSFQRENHLKLTNQAESGKIRFEEVRAIQTEGRRSATLTRAPAKPKGFVGRGEARKRTQFSPQGGNGAERTLLRRKGGEAMRITFHIGRFTVTIVVKSRNRHSAK